MYIPPHPRRMSQTLKRASSDSSARLAAEVLFIVSLNVVRLITISRDSAAADGRLTNLDGREGVIGIVTSKGHGIFFLTAFSHAETFTGGNARS